jgi:hypothetical protein
MIKFEFTLSDVDAQNLISILHDEQVRMLNKALVFLAKVNEHCGNHRAAQANVDWYNAHADYLEGLKKKIAAGSTRVE